MISSWTVSHQFRGKSASSLFESISSKLIPSSTSNIEKDTLEININIEISIDNRLVFIIIPPQTNLVISNAINALMLFFGGGGMLSDIGNYKAELGLILYFIAFFFIINYYF
jgi:hypothetical protein